MTNSEKIYTGLCIIFVSFMVLGNLTYQKFVILQFPFHKFELSVGAILYPLTFFITDLITEIYGKEKSRFCIRFSIFVNILTALIISIMDYLPATYWSKINNETFHNVFGYYGVAFIGSVLACYVSQTVDVYLYVLIRGLTKGKYIWLRSNFSTCISLFIDSFVVIGFMTMLGVFPREQIWVLIISSYSWKMFFTICSTPIFYASLFAIKFFSKD